MLTATSITKIYRGAQGDNTVLDNLHFSASSGQFCMITGKSGCGKSTLLNVLSCLDTFDGGSLHLCGQDVATLTPRALCRLRRANTAFIFQGYNLISSLTALQNVELGLKYKGVKKPLRTALATQALERVDLAHRLHYLPGQLSGGQQQRVAIARAIVLQPKILFCDEPTGNLDPASAQLIMQNIIELKNNGTLVLMITHDNSLLPLADRVLQLDNGRLMQM